MITDAPLGVEIKAHAFTVEPASIVGLSRRRTVQLDHARQFITMTDALSGPAGETGAREDRVDRAVVVDVERERPAVGVVLGGCPGLYHFEGRTERSGNVGRPALFQAKRSDADALYEHDAGRGRVAARPGGFGRRRIIRQVDVQLRGTNPVVSLSVEADREGPFPAEAKPHFVVQPGIRRVRLKHPVELALGTRPAGSGAHARDLAEADFVLLEYLDPVSVLQRDAGEVLVGTFQRTADGAEGLHLTGDRGAWMRIVRSGVFPDGLADALDEIGPIAEGLFYRLVE